MDKLDNILSQTRSVKPPKGANAPPVEGPLWEMAVGSRIAKRAQPVRLDRGILYIRVTTAAWANELSLLATEIVKQLAEHDIEVNELRFSVGPVRQPRRRRGKPRRAAAPDAKLPEPLRDRVAQIADDELKAALAEAAAKSLSVGHKS